MKIKTGYLYKEFNLTDSIKVQQRYLMDIQNIKQLGWTFNVSCDGLPGITGHIETLSIDDALLKMEQSAKELIINAQNTLNEIILAKSKLKELKNKI